VPPRTPGHRKENAGVIKEGPHPWDLLWWWKLAELDGLRGFPGTLLFQQPLLLLQIVEGR
jgi:hypothetical protein